VLAWSDRGWVKAARLQRLAVDHGHRVAKSGFEAGKVTQIRRRGDPHFATKFFGIGGRHAKVRADAPGFVQIAAGHHYMPAARQQRLRPVQA